MERWAAVTLRVLGIIAASLVLIGSSLLILLLAICGGFKPGADQAQSIGLLFGYFVLLILCVFAIVKLGKGIARSAAIAPPIPGEALVEVLPHPLADSSLQMFNYLRLAIIAEIFLSFASWVINNLQRTQQPAYPSGLWIIFLVSALMSQLPYVILLALLKNPPKRPLMAFAVALPAVSILSSVYYLLIFGRYYTRAPQAVASLLLFVAIDIVMTLLAWQLRNRLRYNNENGSLAVAAVVAFVYTGLFHSLTPLLYRFR